MAMHHGNHADERIALHEDDRVWESRQQLAAYAELTWKSDHRPAFGSRSLKRPHRFELIPELGSQSFTLALVAIDRLRGHDQRRILARHQVGIR